MALRLVQGEKDRQPPAGSGWLAVARFIEATMGVLWLLGLWHGIARRGLLDEGAHLGNVAHIVLWAAYALLMLCAAAFLGQRRRWAWRLSVGLAVGSLAVGFIGGQSAAIMVGAALGMCLYAGSEAIEG